jgi:hypothetical protein
MSDGVMNGNAAEAALTRKLAQTLVRTEVIEPMAVAGWQHGAVPSPQQAAVIIAERARKDGATDEQIAEFLKERGVTYTPPAGGTTPQSEGAPAPAPAPAAPVKSGQPAPAASAPAPAAPAKTDAPDTQLEAARNLLALMESLKGSDGKYMGKYPNLDEALKGAGHLANMTKTVMHENETLKAQLSAAGTPAPGVVAPPAAVPAAAPASKPFVPASRPGLEAAQARLDKVLSRVTNDGFDGDSAKEFAEANREVAREQALAVAVEQRERDDHARQSETQRWDAVNAYMAEKYPNSANVDDAEFGMFLKLNPLLTEAMSALRAQGREQRAAELGYTEFEKSRNVASGSTLTLSRADAEKKEIDLSEREQVRKEARDAALKDAGIVHGSAGGASAVEAPGITGPSQDDINAYAAAMRREGDAPGSASAQRWRSAVIGRFLPPELFNS